MAVSVKNTTSLQSLDVVSIDFPDSIWRLCKVLFNRAMAASADFPMQKIAVEIITERKLLISQKIKSVFKGVSSLRGTLHDGKQATKKVWKTKVLLEKCFSLSRLSLEYKLLMRPN